MTDESFVDRMADAMACAEEGKHCWTRVKPGVLDGRWECINCGVPQRAMRESCDGT